MKTITIPDAVLAHDPATDAPQLQADGTPLTIKWPDVVVALFNDPRVLDTLTSFAASDLRSQLLAAKGSVDVNDEEHALLKDLARKPRTINQSALWSVMPFLRAINDAETKA